ncbi:unnamed protein product [Gadus morhua 'NCC']
MKSISNVGFKEKINPAAVPCWEQGPGISQCERLSFSFSSRALQPHTAAALPGSPSRSPGSRPGTPGSPSRSRGDTVPGEPEKEPGEEVPEPGEGVPVELGMDPAPSGAGRAAPRDSSYARRYQVSGEKDADLVGEVSGP